MQPPRPQLACEWSKAQRAEIKLPHSVLPEVGVRESAADDRGLRAGTVAVAGSAGDALVEFDEFVDRLGAAVVGAAGVEVGQERVAPLLQRLAQPLALRDRTRRQ